MNEQQLLEEISRKLSALVALSFIENLSDKTVGHVFALSTLEGSPFDAVSPSPDCPSSRKTPHSRLTVRVSVLRYLSLRPAPIFAVRGACVTSL